jgi:hypothetical protein
MLCSFSKGCKIYAEVCILILIIYYRVVVEMEIGFFGVICDPRLACFHDSLVTHVKTFNNVFWVVGCMRRAFLYVWVHLA